MPDIGKTLRDEIARIAKREAGKLLSAHAKTMRELKNEMALLKKKKVQSAKTPSPATKAPATKAPETKAPEKKSDAPKKPSAANAGFSPADIKKLRARLGLSQAKFAKLCGVSENTVGNWEKSKKKELALRTENLEALTKLSQ